MRRTFVTAVAFSLFFFFFARAGATPIVIRYTSDTVQMGVAGDTTPKVTIPAVVGKPKIGVTAPEGGLWFGKDALAKGDAVDLVFPITNGRVVDADLFGKLLAYAATSISTHLAGAQVMLTEPPLLTPTQRTAIANVMFKSLKVASYGTIDVGMAALTGTGRATGIAVDVGWDVIFATVQVQNTRMPKSSTEAAYGFAHVLKRWRTLNAYGLAPSPWEADLRAAALATGYVPLDPAMELQKNGATTVSFALPSGRTVAVGSERFRAPEVFFDPSLVGVTQQNLGAMVYGAIMQSDPGYRQGLAANVFLVGEYVPPGLADRVKQHLQQLFPASSQIVPNVIALTNAKDAVWEGASVAATVAVARYYTTAEQYAASGAPPP